MEAKNACATCDTLRPQHHSRAARELYPWPDTWICGDCLTELECLAELSVETPLGGMHDG